MPVTGNQIKAARGLLGIDQKELADRASVSVNTVRNLEAFGSFPVGGRIETLNSILAALRTSGVVLLEDGQQSNDGIGVRLVKGD